MAIWKGKELEYNLKITTSLEFDPLELIKSLSFFLFCSILPYFFYKNPRLLSAINLYSLPPYSSRQLTTLKTSIPEHVYSINLAGPRQIIGKAVLALNYCC